MHLCTSGCSSIGHVIDFATTTASSTLFQHPRDAGSAACAKQREMDGEAAAPAMHQQRSVPLAAPTPTPTGTPAAYPMHQRHVTLRAHDVICSTLESSCPNRGQGPGCRAWRLSPSSCRGHKAMPDASVRSDMGRVKVRIWVGLPSRSTAGFENVGASPTKGSPA